MKTTVEFGMKWFASSCVFSILLVNSAHDSGGNLECSAIQFSSK